MVDAREPVGFVGLGNMGLPMITRLVKAGYPVRAFDIAAAARDRAMAAGASLAGDLAEVPAGSGVVILMLPDSGAVGAVLRDAGFAAALTPSTMVIDMSSAEPEQTRALAGELAARRVRMVDAPVS